MIITLRELKKDIEEFNTLECKNLYELAERICSKYGFIEVVTFSHLTRSIIFKLKLNIDYDAIEYKGRSGFYNLCCYISSRRCDLMETE